MQSLLNEISTNGHNRIGLELYTTSPVLCECLQITEAQVRGAAVDHNPHTLKELIRCSGAGKGCTACHPALREILAERGAAFTQPNCSVR